MTLAVTYAILLLLCTSVLGGLILVSYHLSLRHSPWWEGIFYGLLVSGCALAMTWSLVHPSPAASGAILLLVAAVTGGLALTQRPQRTSF